MRKTFGAWLILSIFIVFVLSGCSGNSSPPLLTGTIELNNCSNAAIDRFYLVPVEQASLGSDNEAGFIYPSENKRIVNIDPDHYDAKIGVNGPDSDYFAYVYDIPIVAGDSVVLNIYNSSFTGSLELRNNTSAANISGVYLMPSDASAWGDNQTSSIIEPSGVLHLYDLDPGLYNVKVAWEAGTESIYYGVSIESLALTVYDASMTMQREGVNQNGQETFLIKNNMNLDGNQLQFAPQRLKDKHDYGMELESETGNRFVSIQRYKPSKKGNINIFILNTGDIHESSKKLKYIFQYVRDKKWEHPGRVILLDAGDMLTGIFSYTSEGDITARDWAYQDKKMFNWAYTMNYDAMVFGNHDFIGGVKATQDWIDQFKLPFICANLKHPDLNPSFQTWEEDQQTKYKFITLDNIKLSDGTTMPSVNIGVIGLADIGDHPEKNPLNQDYHHPNQDDKKKLTVDWVDNDNIINLISKVEKKSDFIIFLSHNPDHIDTDFIANLPGKKNRVIVGGHSHQNINKGNVHGKSLVKSGKHGNYVGSTMVEWNPNSRKVIGVTPKNISCIYILSPANYGVSASSNTITMTVTPSSTDCEWKATSNNDWINITSGSSGKGTGNVHYTVAANATGSARTGNITIGGKMVTINQTKSSFADLSDVPEYIPYIYAIYAENYTRGCRGTLYYCPEDIITRGQMSAFIIRANYGEIFTYTTTPYFSDVPSTSDYFKYVQKMKDVGYTVLKGTYGVNDLMDKGMIAAFIIRAKYGESFASTTTPYFSDVPSTHTFFKYVQKMKDEGYAVDDGIYGVDSKVTRGMMAAFLGRAFLGMQ